MKKTAIILGIVLLFLLGCTSGYFSLNQKENDAIKIGAIFPLTGIGAEIGQQFRKGAEIALEEINDSGGINGKKLVVIYEDDPLQDPKIAVTAMEKLATVDKVKAVMDITYTGLASMQKIAEREKVPVIDVIDSSSEIASLGEWVFGIGIFADGVGELIAGFAFNELKARRVGTIVGQDGYLYAISNPFEKEFKRLGGNIVLREEFQIGETDFRSILIKMKEKNVDTIFVAHLGEAGFVVKQAEELGINTKFVGTDTFSLKDVQDIAGSALNEKTFFALWKIEGMQSKKTQEFSRKYKEKFGTEPENLFYNVLGHDGVMVLAEALRKSDLSGESIKQELYKIKNFDGLSGSISINSEGINTDTKSEVFYYKNNQIVKYGK